MAKFITDRKAIKMILSKGMLKIKRLNGYAIKNLNIIKLGNIKSFDNQLVDFTDSGFRACMSRVMGYAANKCFLSKITVETFDAVGNSRQAIYHCILDGLMPIVMDKKSFNHLALITTNKGETFYTLIKQCNYKRTGNGKYNAFVVPVMQ